MRGAPQRGLLRLINRIRSRNLRSRSKGVYTWPVVNEYIARFKSLQIRVLAVQTTRRPDSAHFQTASIERLAVFLQIRSRRATRGGGIDEMGNQELPGSECPGIIFGCSRAGDENYGFRLQLRRGVVGRAGANRGGGFQDLPASRN